MFFELERKYQHAAQFARDPETKVFDSEMMRLEERNVRETLKHGGGEEHFNNCLVIKQYHPPKVTRQHGREITVKGKTHRKVYYYNMKGNKAPVRGSEHETMWRGDGYVTEQPKEGAEYTDIPEEQRQMGSGLNQSNRMPVQKRMMRQSRLFITYSLHRATTSEDEARFLMMRMADAAHELFGNDENLAELLVFGYKIPKSSKKGDKDSVSKAAFEVIGIQIPIDVAA
eukprot:scaffold11123_cov34-Phaeocystis_antarctica.AAC.1